MPSSNKTIKVKETLLTNGFGGIVRKEFRVIEIADLETYQKEHIAINGLAFEVLPNETPVQDWQEFD